MNPKQETTDTWNKLASLYEEKFMDLDLYHASYQQLCSSAVKPRARVLDIGCGPGNITKYLLAQRPDFRILGIDTSPNMIERARKNNPLAEFLVMDAGAIDQLQERFDLIVSGFCLPYLSAPEVRKFITDARRLATPCAMLYLSFVEGLAQSSEYKSSPVGRVHFHYHALPDILQALHEAGFDGIQTMKVAFPRPNADPEEHTIVIGRKGSGG